MARAKSLIIKTVVIVCALAALGFLFVRSVRETRAEPYTIERGRLQNWTVAVEPGSSPAGYAVSLRPRPELGAELFRQVFSRGMESLSAPVTTAIPLVLRSEMARAAGRVTPEALAEEARAAGLETATFEPRCVAFRRISEPGSTRQLYFVLFNAPAYTRFREQIATRLELDATAQSPVMFIAASDPEYSRWLPVRANPEADCIAPITIE